MPMLAYKPIPANRQQFVEFWSHRYDDVQEDLYINNIGKELAEQRIFDLYKWKNGTPLSVSKQAAIQQNFIDRRNAMEPLPNSFSAHDFLARFDTGGAIWRIFWLHCCQPDRFPIYDQHVHRAMAFIEAGTDEEIPQYDRQKIDTYICRYLPFHATFSDIDGRCVDKALWAFRKFIKPKRSRFPTTIAQPETR